MYKLAFMSQARKDAKNLSSSGLKQKAEKLLKIVEMNPFACPPDYEILTGNMKGLVMNQK